MSEHMPRLHPEDLAEFAKHLSAEAKQIFTRENVVADLITLDVDEVGKILKRDPRTIDRYCAKKIIKAFKVGKEWRITQESLNNYINVNS